MLTAVQILPIRYAAGTQLDSLQQRNVAGTSVDITIPVGSRIVIPEILDKVILTERLGEIVIDRFFLRIGRNDKKELIPIYVKIYDAGTAHVLIFKEGVEYIHNVLSREQKKVTFLKDALLQCVVCELEAIDSTLFSCVREFFDQPSLSSLVSNDEVTFLYRPQDEHLLVGYPWNSANLISNSFSMYLLEREKGYSQRFANHLFDLSIQLNIFDDDRCPTQHPLFTELEERFNPQIGDLYSQIAYDPLTQLCLREPQMSAQSILRRSGVLWPRNNLIISNNPFGWKEGSYEKVTAFSSELLQLCVWLHQLPFYELALTYTLPSRDRVANITTHYASFRNRKQIRLTHFDHDVNSVFQFWDNTIYSRVDLIKTGVDELFIHLHGPKNERKMYIDLGITTLLSQSVVRLD